MMHMKRSPRVSISGLVLCFLAISGSAPCGVAAQKSLQLVARSLVPSPKDAQAFFVQLRAIEWNPKQTAIIVCDMWDLHHCLNATNRVAELAPKMNQVLKAGRDCGVLIIHAPSGCMKTYENHPGRQLAQQAPKAANLPANIEKGCNVIPAKKNGEFPIDQSDGGCDSEPSAQATFSTHLKELGRNPSAPWSREHEALEILPSDAISDSGAEIWNLMEQ